MRPGNLSDSRNSCCGTPTCSRSRRVRSSSGRFARIRRVRIASRWRCAGARNTSRRTLPLLGRLERLDDVVGDVDGAADERGILQDQVEVVVLRVLRQHLVEPRLQLVEFLELTRPKVLGELLALPLDVARAQI